MTFRPGHAARWWQPVLVLVLGWTACIADAQPVNDNFTNAVVISGLTGTVSDNNSLATLETGELTSILFDDFTNVDNSVWYEWTAPATGTATFDTIGSTFDTVLAVYTTATGLAAARQIAADHQYTNSLGVIQTNSQVVFSVTAGTNYYISVNGNAGVAPTNDSGDYVLNWSLATITSGNFKFASDITQNGRPAYVVSANESGGVTDPSVSPSWPGARATVTRVGGASGRATVDYIISRLTYTNILQTNAFGTNISLTYIDTNGVGFTTNYSQTTLVYSNLYGYFANGYQQFPVTGALTNSTVTIIAGISTNFISANSLTTTRLVPVPASIPPLTNYTSTSTNVLGGSTYVTIANIFSGPDVTNGAGVTYYYGTNLFTSIIYPGGAEFFTNADSTNIVFYSNSLPVWGTNYFNVSSSNNVQSILIQNSGYVALTPAPTNLPPYGVSSNPVNVVSNADGSLNMGVTNSFSYALASQIQIVPSATGLVGNSGTLFFDDFQMGADITVPIQAYPVNAPGGVQLPALISIVLTNAMLDPLESPDLIAPTIDPVSGQSQISILNNVFVPGSVSNVVSAISIINIERARFRVNENTPGYATVYVTRSGGDPTISCSVNYHIDYNGSENSYNNFPLQADSDYATPNVDYTAVTGTLSGGAGDYNAKPITIPIMSDGLVEFNEDMLLQLWIPVNCVIGAVGTATVTILFNDQPAGAVDRTWNMDNVPGSNPPYIPYPGTSGGVSDSANGNGGTVYAVAEQPDGNAIVAGSFISYDSHPYNRIVRVLGTGYQDPTFQGVELNNSGANNFIAALALQPDGRIIIGGNFTAFNGYNRYHIARLNADGSVDTTFNPGLGVNGDSAMVWSIALQANGQMVIAGDFTSYNGTNVNSVARLNADGSLDTSFNPGTGPDGTVNAVVVDSLGRVIIGGAFDAVAGANCGAVARLNVDGSVDTSFALGVGTYNPGTGSTDPVYALALQTDGKILAGGGFSYVDLVNFDGIVRLNTDGTVDFNFDPGNGTYNPVTGISDIIYAITLQPDGNILIGGDFTTFNQTRRIGVARLFSYGSLDTSFMDAAYNQFAGLVNYYHNPNANNTALYPQGNQRNYTYSIALEAGGNVIIGGGFLRVGGGSTRDDTHPRSNVARLIGGATPGPGNLQFCYSSYTVDKDGKSLYVSLVRTNGNLGIASATFATNMPAPGPGIASVTNFTMGAASLMPIWDLAWSGQAWMKSDCRYGPNYAETPTSDGAAAISLTINNNTNHFGNVNANMLLTNPTGTNFFLGGEEIALGVALGAQSTAPVTIIDDTVYSGTLSFSSPQYSVSENGTNATITVVRTSGSDGIVQVSYATADGVSPNGATNGVDYTSKTGTLTFQGGITSQTFTIPIIQNTFVRPDLTLKLRLLNVTGGASLGLTNATLTIINSVYTYGHISFSSATYGTNENSGYAYVTINRVGGSTGAIKVDAIVSDGTAVNGTNYIGSTNTLQWIDGIATPVTIAIPVMDDHLVTSNLTVNLRLTNGILKSVATPNVLGLSQYTNATLTITNVDSHGTVQFNSAVFSVKKSGGYAVIPVTRVGGSCQTVDVNYATVPGTAVDGVNYTGTNGTLHFAVGELSKFITVPVIEDNQIDGPLALNLILTNASPANAMGAISNTVLNIIDTDEVYETPGSPDPTYYAFGFNNTVYALAQQSDQKLLVGGDFTQADGVPRQRIARLNANGTMDATFLLPTLTMGASDSVRALAIQADGRILVGGLFTNFDSKAFNYITRLNTDGTYDSTFNPGSAANNPVYALAETFVGGVSKVLVGGAFAVMDGMSYNGIARLNSDGTPDATFNPGLGANAAVYALALQSDGKVVIGGDFTAVNGNTNFNHIARLNLDGSLDTTFNVGTGPNNSVRAITIQLDGEILLGGLFTSVNGSTNFNHIARLNQDGSADATFNPGLGANDAVFSIALQTDSRIVLGGEFTRASGVTRNRITRLLPNGAVDPTINFGWGANSFVAAVLIQEATITGYPTNVPDEKIIIGGGFTQYDNESHPYLARIYGGSIGGSGAFEFSAANYSADENSTNVVITVLRTGGTSGTNSDGSGDVLVPFSTSDGTARAGTNYVSINTDLDFPLGEVVKLISVPVLDDYVITPDLTVNLEVDPVPPAQYGNQPTAVLTIINDESTISFASANYQVAKNIVSGTAAINIVRLGSTNGTATVSFATTTNGTAVAGTDYSPVSQTVVFNPGATNVTAYIPIISNGHSEGNRTVSLQLSGVSGSVFVSPTNATLTIIDTVHAPGLLSFASDNYTNTEGGGVGYTNTIITVIRTFGSSGTVSVGFNTVDGTAVAGTKYMGTNGVLVFGDGESSKTFTVQVRNTTTAEGPESLFIVLTNATGGAALTTPSTTILTILNTNTGIAFVSATNAYTEPSSLAAGLLNLNVIRFNNTNGTTTVNYSITNGTAVAGTDFVGVTNGVLTFNPGDSVKSIAVTTLHNTNVTGDLFFTVGLSNPSGLAQLTPPSFTVVTDHDADAGLSFYTNAVSVARNAGYLFVPVMCSNTNVEPLTVNYTTVNGTALAGTDYTAMSGTLAFTNGAFYNYFYVPILLNNSVQSNRTFTMVLSSPTGAGVLVQPWTETVTIVGTNTPSGLSFMNPQVINGDWGSIYVDNTMGAAEAGDPVIAGQPATAPVWFQWTAPADGEVSLDTLGSYGTNGVKLDTVLGVYTGGSLSTLNQVAANDDLYPQLFGNTMEEQFNEAAQNIFNTNPVITAFTNYSYINNNYTAQVIYRTNNLGQYTAREMEYYQPYGGPSGLRFNAKAGTTYYIAADTKASYSYIISNGMLYPVYSGRGPISLNWAYHPSGMFRFATENIDQTGIHSTNGNPMLLYECAETETDRRTSGTINADQYHTTFHSYYDYDADGLLVTITRVAGSSGRVAVDYATVDGDTNLITNGDLPAIADLDYFPASGTLVFDDYEMSKTILIQIEDDDGVAQPNRDFMVVLSNPRLDPTESSEVSAPRVDAVYGQALCRILDCDIDPKGPSLSQIVDTNAVPNVTNTVINLIPTNVVFNFQKKSFRVGRDAQSAYWGGTPISVYVNRMGTNNSAVTLAYRIDNNFRDKNSGDDDNIYFPLMAGSDYATPYTANPPKDGGIFGPTNFDFTGADGESGTLSFPAGNGAFNPQPVHFTIYNNKIPQFNKDIHIGLYQLDSNGNPLQDGMVAECTLTILFDDFAPPAGSVDEFYNPDFGVDMAVPTATIGSAVPHPGTEAYSEVYSVAVTTNDQAVIGGAFATYTDGNNTHTVNGLARLNKDGSLDTTFDSGSGINVNPGGEFIRSVALSGSQMVIAGSFTSYRGIQRNGVARVNSDGTLDATFSPGQAANGKVWSVLVQPDNKIVIGGEFTTYNGLTANHVARLNTDGTLDTTFNASNIITGPVYAMALPATGPLFFGSHVSNGSTNEDDNVLNLGSRTAGTLMVNYVLTNPPDQMQVYYGDTNVAAGTGVLLLDTGSMTNLLGNFAVPFGTINGFTTNIITIVMNPGGSTNASPVLWSYNAYIPGQTGLLIGGNFNVAGQTYANIAELNADGSLNTSFSPSTGPDNSVLSLAWQADNKVIAGGAFKRVSGVSFNRLARLNADGSLDANFYIGTGADNTVNSITLQTVSGLIYIGGPFTSINGTHRLGFARLNADGTVDTTFLDTAYNQLAGLPRIRFSDSPGVVYSSGIQSDGNVIIGGSFSQVGGGQFDAMVRPNDYTVYDISTGSYTYDPVFDTYLNMDVWPEPKTRDGVRNRGNVARLIGGATPGPGNLGLAAPSYAANKTQSYEAVTLIRTNGSLGYASANFSVLPGVAQSGVDYAYSGSAPTYPIEWEYMGPTRQHSDGLYGANGLMEGNYGDFYSFGFTGPASLNVSIINNASSSGNLSAQFQLANPGADQFYLGGQNIPLGVALGESLAPLTVVDNSHQDGVFGFASSSYTATNSSVLVNISRTNGTAGTVQVSYQTTTNGNTAVAGTDYIPTNGVLTFTPGQSSNAFPVTIVQNSYVSGQEKTVNLQLYNVQDLSSGNASLGRTNALLRIINPNYQGTLSFTTNAYYGKLSDRVVTCTVMRAIGSKGTLTLQYATADGTAVNGVDYTGSASTLTWNNGDVSPRTITISLINPNVVGSAKQFGISLFNPTWNGTNAPIVLGATTNAVLTIINDNSYGTFQFSSPSCQVNENGGYATLTVMRSGSALGTGTVSYATADGTAFAGTNYMPTNGMLTFLPGKVSQSFQVRLRDDGRTNPPPAGFYFSVILANAGAGSSLGSPTNESVHILDAESYNQTPGSVDTSFDATAGMNASVLALALQSDGRIVAGGAFTVANGTGMNRIARLNTDGTLDEGFLNGMAGVDGSVNALINQADDRIVVGGAFANIDGVVRHGVARLMTDGSLDTSFNPGSGADSTVFALAETFINGSREIYVGGAFSSYYGTSSPGVVRLNNDGTVDASFATGLGANGTVYAIAAYPTNSVYNAGKVLVGGLFTNFNGSVVGNLVRLNGDGSLDTNFSYHVSADSAVRAIAIQLDDKVLIGGDFTNVNAVAVHHLARLNATDGTLDTAFNTQAAPGFNGTVSTIVLQADNCLVVGGQFTSANGTFRHGITRLLPTGAVDPTINFGDGANGAVNAVLIQPADGKLVLGGGFTQYDGQPHDYIVRIYGGSMTGSGAFQFSSAGYQIDETGGFATITVQRTGGTSGTNADGSGDVHVAFTTANGTAVAGVNYSSVTNYLDFPAGEVSQTIYVPVMDDLVITTNLTVNLMLSNPTPGTGLGDQANALLTIINDDSVVKFQSATYSVPKNTVNGVATIDIVRLGSTSGGCTVNFATGTNGNAVAGTDYYPTNALVTFNPGDTDVKVQVAIINNLLPEGNRTVSLALTNVLNTLPTSAANTMLSSPSNAVLTIIDTIQAPGNLYFVATNFTANSSEGLAYLTVGRTNGTSGSVSATYYTVPGSALPGLNYVATTNTVTFNDGDVSKVFTIPLVYNLVAQSAVSLTVDLVSPTGGAALIAPTNTTLTIYNTNAAINFVLATNVAPEDSGSVSIVVQRLNNTNIISTVQYATADGNAVAGYSNAVAGINYSNTSGTLTFGVNEALKSITIPLIHDTNVTGDLAFNVRLFNVANAQLITPSNTVVVIQDAEAGVSFTTNSQQVLKSAGAVVVTVVCSNPRVEPVLLTSNTVPLEVQFTTRDGTALQGTDYQKVSGTLVFTNGMATNTFTVPIYNNTLVSGNHAFTVVLTNVTAPGVLTAPSTQTVVIAESNAGLRFSQSSYTVPKNSGSAVITVYRTGFTDSVASVNFLATNGTALNGVNFVSTNGTLIFTNGVTSQTFNVPLIANSLVQPNLYVQLQLLNPTNGSLVSPSAAILNLMETGGSYVVPAGAQVVTNYTTHAGDGIISSNDTVQVLFALRDSAGLNVTNLIATLLATNGVVSPSPASQTYGPLTVYGHSVSRAFTYTASGTNNLPITPTFNLYDNAKFIGTAVFTNILGTWTTNFANTNAIIINDNTNATPYPSMIVVSGMGSTLVKATVTLTNLTHNSPTDIGALVVSPAQKNTLIMGHAGGSFAVKQVTLTFDDNAPTNLPQSGQIVTGTNKPSAYGIMQNFP